MRLFCLPYAGGSPNIFRSWAQAVPAEVELVALRLPGRDLRIREPAFTAWAPLLDAVEAVVRPCLDRPFMFFGHSFGARIAFEITKRLEDGGHPTPAHLFISGCRTPDDPPPEPRLHALPREEFYERVRKMKGTPAEVLLNRRLMEILEPTLRADMGLHNEPWETSPRPIRSPIAALSGAGDEIDPPHVMRGWGRHTAAELSFHSFPGDHFFLHSDEQEVLRTVAGLIERHLHGGAAHA